jgi:sugar-specific transcriptional regulator TrmB
MSAYDNEKAKPVQDLQKLIAGIQDLKSNPKQEKSEMFQRLYPAIKEALDRAVTQSSVLAFLKANGLKLSPNTFRTMLVAASKRVEEDGQLAGQQTRNS